MESASNTELPQAKLLPSVGLHRVLLLAINIAGLLLIAAGFNTGFFQALFADLPGSLYAGSFVARGLAQESTAAAVVHFAYFFALAMAPLSQIFVIVILAKPLTRIELLHLSRAVTLLMLFLGLYLAVHETAFGSRLLPQNLVFVVAVICFSGGLLCLTQFFALFPLPLDITMQTYEQPSLVKDRLRKLEQNLPAGKWNTLRKLLAFDRRIGDRVLAFQTRFIWRGDRRGFVLARYAAGVQAVALLLLGFLPKKGSFLTVVAIVAVLYSTLLLLIYCTNKLILDFRKGDATVKKQVAWIYYAATIGGWIYAAQYFGLLISIPWFEDNWRFLGASVLLGAAVLPVFMYATLLAGLTIAIYFYGAIDPARTIRLSVVYTLVALILALVFLILQAIFSSQLVASLGMSEESGAFMAGILAALIFDPVKTRVEGRVKLVVDRWLPPEAMLEATRAPAAVVFNDLSGYSALMERDQDAALALAAIFHNESQSAAAKFKGRVVKTLGDTVLMEFADAADAMKAVVQVHRNYHRACRGKNLLPLAPHAGLHYGEIIRSPHGDIYGNAVNIAAHLESRAGADELIISAAGQVAARSHGFELQDLGELSLKNMLVPVQCYRMSTREAG